MSQMKAMAAKVIVTFDGDEIAGLVKYGEYAVEKGMIEVPEFDKIINIHNNIKKIVPLELTYKIERTSSTLKFFRNWFKDIVSKDVVVSRCDAYGVEYERILLPQCELAKFVDPEYDAANPTFAKITITILPSDYITLI